MIMAEHIIDSRVTVQIDIFLILLGKFQKKRYFLSSDLRLVSDHCEISLIKCPQKFFAFEPLPDVSYKEHIFIKSSGRNPHIRRTHIIAVHPVFDQIFLHHIDFLSERHIQIQLRIRHLSEHTDIFIIPFKTSVIFYHNGAQFKNSPLMEHCLDPLITGPIRLGKTPIIRYLF